MFCMKIMIMGVHLYHANPNLRYSLLRRYNAVNFLQQETPNSSATRARYGVIHVLLLSVQRCVRNCDKLDNVITTLVCISLCAVYIVYIYVYLYIYICVCACMCVLMIIKTHPFCIITGYTDNINAAQCVPSHVVPVLRSVMMQCRGIWEPMLFYLGRPTISVMGSGD